MNDPTDLKARFIVNAGKSDIGFSINNVSVRESVHSNSVSPEPVDQVELDCFPNPSSKSLFISYYLEQSSAVVLYVYKLSGQLVETIDLGIRGAGRNEFIYNTSWLSNGTYLIRLKTGIENRYKKIIIVN